MAVLILYKTNTHYVVKLHILMKMIVQTNTAGYDKHELILPLLLLMIIPYDCFESEYEIIDKTQYDASQNADMKNSNR